MRETVVDNPVQFAIVREDPEIELSRLGSAERVLLVASGGCTGFTIAARRPDCRITMLDANRAQLDLVERKLGALQRHAPGSVERAQVFGVGRDDGTALTACGNFESLFRAMRAFLDNFGVTDRRALLGSGVPPKNRYWPVAFQMFFSDVLLEAMFGRDATQHAARGSYPGYFQRAIEEGIARPDAATNPWLHHILLGHYLDGALPEYLNAPCTARFDLVHATMANAPHLRDFDLISLSNLFDWMNADGIKSIVDRLNAECRANTTVILRQLNNRSPVETMFAPAFAVEEITTRDRSLFYERVLVLTRRP